MFNIEDDFDAIIKTLRYYNSIESGNDSELIKYICGYLEFCLAEVPNDCWSEYKIGNQNIKEVLEDISYALSIGIEFICRSGKIYYKRKV